MDKQSCISNQLWIGYSAKTLSQADTDMILSHAETCEVCTDIKEGIDAMNKPESLNERVTGINKKADDYLKPNRNLSLFWYWSAAAILVFGIGFSWFLIDNEKQLASKPDEKPVFENKTNPTLSNPELKDIPLAKNDNPVFKKENNYETNVVENDADGRSSQVTEDIFKPFESIKIPDTSTYVFRTTPDTMPRGISLAFDNKTDNDDSYSSAPQMESMDKDDPKSKDVQIVSAETKSLKKRKVETAKRKSAANPDPLSNSNVSNNSNSFKNSYSKDSSNLALAKTNYTQNNYDKCLENLTTITANPSSLYYEDALLLKAKTFIKQNKIKEAKAILKTLISLKGNKKSEAEGLMKGLK